MCMSQNGSARPELAQRIGRQAGRLPYANVKLCSGSRWSEYTATQCRIQGSVASMQPQCLLLDLQAPEQLRGHLRGHRSPGSAGVEFGPGGQLHLLDGHLHGHAPCGRRCSPAPSQVSSTHCSQGMVKVQGQVDGGGHSWLGPLSPTCIVIGCHFDASSSADQPCSDAALHTMADRCIRSACSGAAMRGIAGKVRGITLLLHQPAAEVCSAGSHTCRASQ